MKAIIIHKYIVDFGIGTNAVRDPYCERIRSQICHDLPQDGQWHRLPLRLITVFLNRMSRQR